VLRLVLGTLAADDIRLIRRDTALEHADVAMGLPQLLWSNACAPGISERMAACSAECCQHVRECT
jgi:hypothetical protein